MLSRDFVDVFNNFFIKIIISAHLQSEFDRKKKAHYLKIEEKRRNKEERLKKRVEEDLNEYKEGLLQVPDRHDPDASLESVDLDDPIDDMNANEALEAFLNEPNVLHSDVLYDVSPLPKDETPLKKEDITDNPPINVLSVESPYGSGVLSREDSMYYTPDATTEKLSDISLE